ncbi:MAG: trypsin-like peptidase domain-containing protein [Leptolyngbyaceae cyanobacterium MO_188.B28]|nr:trypsin-like peptidase domain-containing protein [Leptolyngbyaceae cyanobacterium MO_188.B28]
MTTKSPNFDFAFHNQEHALNRVKNSLGELVVLDALPGYGKTAFLTKVQEEYETQQWQCALVPLLRARSKIDTVIAALETIDPEAAEPQEDVSQALEMLIERLQPGQPLALMFDDVHCLQSQALDWVKRKLAPSLQAELKYLTGDNFLLIFSGHNIRSSTPWPPGSRSIELTAFQRDAINQFIDVANIAELWRSRPSNYRYFVVDRIFQFSGGHPRASIGLLNELGSGWNPSPNFFQRDLGVFEKHVERELSKFTKNLEPVYQDYLSHLVIFRSIDFATLKVIEQKYELPAQQNPTQLIREFRQSNLLLSNRYAPGLTVLKPVVRQGLLVRMMLQALENYQTLHRFAQQTYQNWASNSSRTADDVIRCLRESVYHCLCCMEERRRLEQQSEFMDCLQYCIQILNRRQAELPDLPRSILETLLDGDEESRTLLQQLDADWIGLLNFAFAALSHSSLPEETSPQAKHVQRQCKTLTIALTDEDGEVLGTGFWIEFEHQLYAVTCAHVIKQLRLSEGEQVQARTFGPNIQDLDLEIVWYRVPEDRDDKDWTAQQDIAILRPVFKAASRMTEQLGLTDLLPLNSDGLTQLQQQQSTTLYSFGYPAPKRFKGESFSSLVCDEQVGNGFVKLLNLGPVKVEGGVSGAPLLQVDTKQLIGMIHAKLGSEVVYFIPAPTILEILAELNTLAQ